MHRFALAATFLCFSVVTYAQAPKAVVESAVAILDKALTERKDELESDSAALYALVDDILAPRFDRKYAAQLVLARNWRSATAEQRRDFTETFYDSLVRKYARGLLDFDQTRVEVLEYRGDVSKKRTTVKTIVTLDDGTKTPVNYVLVKRESGWLIFDVVIEGISYVRNFRVEMAEEIRTTSLDAVIERLRRDVSDADKSGATKTSDAGSVKPDAGNE